MSTKPQPSRALATLLAVALGALPGPPLGAQEAGDPKAAAPAAPAVPTAPAPLDEVTLKDGSRILGEVVGMEGGVLTIKNAFAAADDLLKVEWSEVQDLKTARRLPFVLKDGSRLNGKAGGVAGGSVSVKLEDVAQPSAVPLASVVAINPAEKPPYTFQGVFTLGASISDGNTNVRTASANGELESRIEKMHRFTLRGAYNYGEDEDGVTLRNGKGSIKYDYFVWDRLYVFVSALFEHDAFQDLRLRTALSAGPGFQVIERGDFQGELLREMQLYAEAGVAYFSEDHRRSDDDQFVSARWSMKFDWAILPKRIALFHFHEGFPGLERAKDLYISTEQGVRFTILEGLIAAFQVNWRWDATPTPGFERDDTLYLVSVGYSFDR
ncbi:MAG: DUF481 domain-containing protein [Planctomycetes bacterium]|nr:DUF481 domain-containing protein [Planctomycetota bacterium]